MICRLEGFLRGYLEKVGFDLKEEKARFVKRLFCDTVASFIYSFTSILLIIMHKADSVVLGLNILSLFRAAINNTIYASEITIKSSDTEDKIKKIRIII